MSRPISLSREASHFRLVFAYDPTLLDKVKALPFASFDGDSKSWTVWVCEESVRELRGWYYQGLVDAAVDDLIGEDEELVSCPPALLDRGTARRPYVVRTAWRDDNVYSRLRAIPTSSWDKKARAITLGPAAAVALRELVDAGALADPTGILVSAETVIAFDPRWGRFKVFGDERAQMAFDKHFPQRDIVGSWLQKDLSVAFADDFSEEVYRGELLRSSEGIQPEGLLLPLYPYQAESVAVALERSGFGVFSAPGLGKTSIGVAWGLELLNRQEVNRVVIVCPASVRTQWRNEIERFTGMADIAMVDGDARKRAAAYNAAGGTRWMIVHHDVLHRDLKSIQPLVAGSAVVVDECHRFKNPTAKRTKALATLGKVSARRLALTGTPVESVPDEWFNVLSFAVPGGLGGPQDFLNRYMFPNKWGGFEGARNLDELRDRSKFHYIRHTKAQVAPHLPPLRVQHMVLDPDPAYAAALKRAHKEAREEIARERRERAIAQGKVGALDGQALDEIESGSEMTAVGMLKLLCCSPRLVADSESAAAGALSQAGVIPDQDGPKLDELRSIAVEMQSQGERVVVFTSSKRMANLCARRFDEDGTRYVLYTGDTSHADREIARQRFVDPQDDVTVFIATDAGAEGLNLGKCCSTLINLDIPWTPSRLEQRSNRIHRIDGTAPRYLVINMTLRGTIEEGILKMVEAKADLTDAIFGETGGRERTTGRKRRRFDTYIYDMLERGTTDPSEVVEDWQFSDLIEDEPEPGHHDGSLGQEPAAGELGEAIEVAG